MLGLLLSSLSTTQYNNMFAIEQGGALPEAECAIGFRKWRTTAASVLGIIGRGGYPKYFNIHIILGLLRYNNPFSFLPLFSNLKKLDSFVAATK
jgi:hypothetical protein